MKRDDTGVFTVEGNLAGSRAGRLTKMREQQKADYERKKQEIASKGSVRDISSKFQAYDASVEQEFHVRAAHRCDLAI